jgi:dinuclear metal center YbgI/SA1388 family protein
MNGLELKNVLETLYPLSYAEDWDNVGLQIGTLKKDVKNILVTLDVTLEVVEEAIATNADVIISHHPLIFKPIQSLISDTYIGAIITKLITHSISLYVIHTNFDVADEGMNHLLSKKLNLRNMEVLENEVEQGIGVIGEVDSILVSEFIPFVKGVFGLDHIKLIGNEKDTINKVAIIGGSGSSYLYLAKKRGADLYITGDVTYHKALDAKAIGLTVLDVGHHVELVFIEGLIETLNSHSLDVHLTASVVDTNPYQNK